MGYQLAINYDTTKIDMLTMEGSWKRGYEMMVNVKITTVKTGQFCSAQGTAMSHRSSFSRLLAWIL
jgi:hypothetical protein